MDLEYGADGAAEAGTLVPAEMKVEDAILGYILFGLDGGTGWTGATMLTDFRTRPLHFGFATPIRPGALQRLLYGVTLDEYVKVDVIATKLIGDLPRVPTAMFVESPELISVRRVAQFPVASLQRPQAVDGSPNLSVVQLSTGENQVDYERIAPLIAALETSVNLLDPFARMREALNEALKEVQKTVGRGQTG